MKNNLSQKAKTLLNIKNTYCRLKPSKISGVGIFAIRVIPKGKEIFQGAIIQPRYNFTFKELKNLDKGIKKMIADFFTADKSGAISIPTSGLNGIDISFYLNHSNKPNVKTIDGGTTFVTLRKIKKNEELTVDYDSYDCQTSINLK